MKKILITGSKGLLGSEIVSINSNCLSPTKKELNLLDNNNVENYFKNNSNIFNSVIHLAAKVGGVKANTEYVSDFYLENSIINNNILLNCQKNKINKVISILSTCIYPDSNFVQYPLTEEQLHAGPPHHSNFGYAFAKRMLDVQTRAYRQQYGCKFITAIPNNLYGLNDNFDIENGHVIPALIRKFYEAKINKYEKVIIWGSGRQIREFTFARDAAKIILWLLENYDDDFPINIGNTEQISIFELSKIISEIIEFEGKIEFDTSKPEGQLKKPSSNLKLLSLGYKEEYTPIKIGLKETINYFIKNYPNLRGI